MAAPIILLFGPTASGKSATALKLARLTNGIIINADAMQVYDCLATLTARPQTSNNIKHLLYGTVAAETRYSIASYLTDIGHILNKLLHLDNTVIITGGTGLYFDGLLNGISKAPAVAKAVMTNLQRQLAENGLATLHNDLKQIDPASYDRITINDHQRIIRALAVYQATGVPLSKWPRSPSILADHAISKLVLLPPRQQLYEKINARVEAMVNKSDFFAEISHFASRKIPDSLPAAKIIGAKYFMAVTDGKMTLDEAIELTSRDTRRYAKRQMTWLRNKMADWPVINPLASDEISKTTDKLVAWTNDIRQQVNSQ